MRHGILTIVAPLQQGTDAGVRKRLRALTPVGFPCDRLVGLHFASLSVIDSRGNAPTDFAPHALFEASFDGPREDFINDLVTLTPAAVDEIFRDCEGYPAAGTTLPEVVKEFLFHHDEGADCVYIAYPGRTVDQIRQESQLRNEVARRDGENRAVMPGGPAHTQRSRVSLLRRQVSSIPDLRGALTLPERPFIVTYGPQIGGLLLNGLGALAFVGLAVSLSRYLPHWPDPLPDKLPDVPHLLLPTTLFLMSVVAGWIGFWRPKWYGHAVVLLVAAAVAWLVRDTDLSQLLSPWVHALVTIGRWLFWMVLTLIVIPAIWIVLAQLHEWLVDPDPPNPSWDSAREHELRRLENLRAQNHMVGLNAIKPGVMGLLFFRRWTVKAVLWIIHATKHLQKSGMLAGISTIHFARWVVIDHGRQVLFVSHYDGDWDAYLGDFVEQARHGLTAIWSNCVGFPRAWFLMFGGARDQRAFKAYARRSQHETLFVYSAYPQLTVSNIENHTAIRQALGSSLETEDLEALFRRL
ncbi:MAG: hypothetical protein ACRD15_16230 [Vicinamibacterales bacterium]